MGDLKGRNIKKIHNFPHKSLQFTLLKIFFSFQGVLLFLTGPKTLGYTQ